MLKYNFYLFITMYCQNLWKLHYYNRCCLFNFIFYSGRRWSRSGGRLDSSEERIFESLPPERGNHLWIDERTLLAGASRGCKQFVRLARDRSDCEELLYRFTQSVEIFLQRFGNPISFRRLRTHDGRGHLDERWSWDYSVVDEYFG